MRVLKKVLNSVFLTVLLAISFSLLITHEVRADTTAWDINLEGNFVVSYENGDPKWMAQKTGKWLKEHGGPSDVKDDAYYIVWVQKDTRATSGIRWATQSIIVSEHAVNNYNARDSAAGQIGEYQMEDPSTLTSTKTVTCGKVSDVTLSSEIAGTSGSTCTMFYINQTPIDDWIDGSTNADLLSEKFTIFLNPIILTYTRHDDDSKTLRKSGISNLADWKAAETWSNPSSFATHYNLMVTFERNQVKVKEDKRARTESDAGYRGYSWSASVKVEDDCVQVVPAGDLIQFHPDTTELTADDQAHVRHAASASGSDKNASWICTGFYYFGVDSTNNNESVELEHCYLGAKDLKSVQQGEKLGIYYDHRLDKNGNVKNVNEGMASISSVSSSSDTSRKTMTPEKFSAWTNTDGYCYFTTGEENMKYYTLVWQYSRVKESPVKVENYYLKTDYSGIPSSTKIDAGNTWTADSSNGY